MSVRFDERGIVPDNHDFLTNISPESCTSFGIPEGRNMAQQTKFRIYLDDDEDTVGVIVNVTGTNLGCGYNLYVSPLAQLETEKWTGRWSSCPILEISTVADKDICSYNCTCRGGCEEIQIMKWPRSIQESYWTLCEVFFTFIPACTLSYTRH